MSVGNNDSWKVMEIKDNILLEKHIDHGWLDCQHSGRKIMSSIRFPRIFLTINFPPNFLAFNLWRGPIEMLASDFNSAPPHPPLET